MRLDEKKVAVAAACAAVAGIALLLFLSETAQKASIASALVADENTLLEISGRAANVTSGKFSLCERLCISVRSNSLPAALLLYEGKEASVLGRVKVYQGNHYIVAEKIEVK